MTLRALLGTVLPIIQAPMAGAQGVELALAVSGAGALGSLPCAMLGLEAGGHRGMFLSRDLSTQLGTMALVPQIVRKVGCPVIAAGGIADAQGVAAAMALGAAGVQIGTAYLLCPEAATSPVHRSALASPAAQHTALTNLFSGRAARGIVNRMMRELGPIGFGVPAFPLAGAAINPLRASAESRGSGDFSPLWAGQNTSGCREIPAADLTRELATGL